MHRKENSLIISLRDLRKTAPPESPKPIVIIGDRQSDKVAGFSLSDEIKWALRGKHPKVNKLGINFDVFIESITDAVSVPDKSVVLMKAKSADGKGKDRYILSKVPPEAVMDDSSLIDIGYDGNGVMIIPATAYTYYISRIKKKKEAKREEGIDLDVSLEITGNHELDLIGDFLMRLKEKEIGIIITNAEYKAAKRIVVPNKIQSTLRQDKSGLPCLEAGIESGKRYIIYLIKEKNAAARAVGDKNRSGVVAEYPLPSLLDECIQVDTGEHVYAVLIKTQ